MVASTLRIYYNIIIVLQSALGARDPIPLLERLVDVDFDLAIFCPNSTTSASVATNSADQTKKSVDDSWNRKTCMDNIEAWQRVVRYAKNGNILWLRKGQTHGKTNRLLFYPSIW